jgi:hypothetical protein
MFGRERGQQVIGPDVAHLDDGADTVRRRRILRHLDPREARAARAERNGEGVFPQHLQLEHPPGDAGGRERLCQGRDVTT